MQRESRLLTSVPAIVARSLRGGSTLLVIAACALALHSTAVSAAETTYVSISGSNANACTLNAPCRTLQRGIHKTPPGGELRILESGDYGDSATVSRSITVSGNGNTVLLGAPLTIDQANAVVTLRGLTLNGRGAVAYGIQILAAATVHIERCVTHGFTNHGIYAFGPGLEVSVIDTISRDNGSAGFLVWDTASKVTIDNSHFHSNTTGVVVSNGHTTISRSTVANNNSGIMLYGGAAIVTTTTATGNAGSAFGVIGTGNLTLDTSIAHGNAAGLYVTGVGRAVMSNSTFTFNQVGISNGNFVATRKNNTIRNNGTDIANPPMVAIDGM